MMTQNELHIEKEQIDEPETISAPEVEAEKETPSIEKLPIHALRSALRDQEIYFKTTDKKKDLIEMLKSGKTIHVKKPKKKAPRLEEQKSEHKAVPVVPVEIRNSLSELEEKGLKWEIDKETGCINFMRDIPTCANLDQPASNILRTARAAFAQRRPVEKSGGS
jgi:hypothetical protein